MAKAKQKIRKFTNLIIIDASGSMQDKVEEVKGGLKQIVGDIVTLSKKDKKTIKSATIVTDFSGQGDFNILVSTDDSVGMDSKFADSYQTRGMTALYDAIAKSFALVKNSDAVFVSILTDGDENDSKEIDHVAVKSLIEEKRKKGWAITFMGTTEASLDKAVAIGISKGNTFAYSNNAVGATSAMRGLGTSRMMFYSKPGLFTGKAKGVDDLMEDTKKELDEEDKNGTS